MKQSLVHDMRILGIHGAPRSGTSWLGQLFNSHPNVAYRYQPFFSYQFRDRVTPSSTAADFQELFKELLSCTDDFVLQRGSASLARVQPEFVKEAGSCLVYKEVRFHELLPRLLKVVPEARLVGIVRDPRAVLASWISAPREFDPSWDVGEEWRWAARKNAGSAENWFGFERWKELATLLLDLHDRYPERVALVRYEDLVENTLGELGRLLEFTGLELTPQVNDFVHASTRTRDDDPYGVYRDRRGRREADVLPEAISRAIVDELSATRLAKFVALH